MTTSWSQRFRVVNLPYPFILRVFLLLLISSNGISTNEEEEIKTAKCIVCDSQRHPECADDALLGKSFETHCKPGWAWCYKSFGKVEVLGYVTVKGKEHLKKVTINKVDRGCARPFNDQQCVRVLQKGGHTDFTVCVCNGTSGAPDSPGFYCNREFDIPSKVNISHEHIHKDAAGRLENQHTLIVMLVNFAFIKWIFHTSALNFECK